MRYNNYHKHDHAGNPWSIDVVTKEYEYCERAKELGHTTCFTVNHGVQGRVFDWPDLSKKYGLKLIYGTEAYYVPDRHVKVDRNSKHLIIIAKNNNGVEQLNEIMSEAHENGFYYKPRVDNELIQRLNPKDFVLTTACIAGIWDDTELILALHNMFGENFFLEIQNHNIDIQKKVNERLLELHQNTCIGLIHANDSHYIYPQDAKYRNIFLNGKGFGYPEENGMILDYPDSDTIFERYELQNVLSRSHVEQALENTLIFDECEEITIINDEIKLPPISDNPTEELKRIINENWIMEMDNIPKEERPKYIDAIRDEMKTIIDTKMENYFLIDYYVVKRGQEKYDGRLTNTGRGSAPSFYTTKMLGLTDIDRVAAPITLFPSRFMSTERILGAKSLPDIDLNTTDREPFIKATEDLLGAENCAWMISWKPLQEASAFRVYCKGSGLDISEYDDVAKNLDYYKDDKKWRDLIKESQRFIGVIESISESPCSMVLYDKPVNREIGLVRTKAGKICCLLDGYNCDKYKYLKNDYLTVTVWAIIRDVCKMANIPIPTINEIDKLLDDNTYEIYKQGLTCTINQADSDFATGLVKQYQPHSVSEMSAFVAIIRPGCKSLLDDFIQRKPYTTGVQELDDILIEGNHRMIYQELIMKYLIWLGIPETGSYDIIKKIAKKKFKEPELVELKGKLLEGWIKRVGSQEGFDETWSVVQDAAKYSFNASHSLSYAYDSLYGAYLKSHYPLEYYTVAFNYYDDDNERTPRLTNELSYFGIELRQPKFRYSKAEYMFSREDNSIYKGIKSIKDLNEDVGNELYELRNNQYDSFVDLLYDMRKNTTIKKNQIAILIKLDFFSEFGEINNLLTVFNLFIEISGNVQIGKEKAEKLNISKEIMLRHCGKEAAKTYMQVDTFNLLVDFSHNVKVKKRSLQDKIKDQIEYLGYAYTCDRRYSRMLAIISVDTKYSPKLKCYSLKNGTMLDCKISKKDFYRNKVDKYDIIRVKSQQIKPKSRKNEFGEWEKVEGTSEIWLTKYEKVVNL